MYRQFDEGTLTRGADGALYRLRPGSCVKVEEEYCEEQSSAPRLEDLSVDRHMDGLSARMLVDPGDGDSTKMLVDPGDELSAKMLVNPGDELSAKMLVNPGDENSARMLIEPGTNMVN